MKAGPVGAVVLLAVTGVVLATGVGRADRKLDTGGQQRQIEQLQREAAEEVRAINEYYRSLPPCPEEDSPGPCFWDARTRGNGLGYSFAIEADGNIVYIPEGK